MSEAISETLALLQKNTLFRGFSQKQLQAIIPLTHEVNFEAQEYIIHEDQPSTQLYIIKSGKLEVLKKNGWWLRTGPFNNYRRWRNGWGNSPPGEFDTFRISAGINADDTDLYFN